MVTIYYTMKLYDGLNLGGLVGDACYFIFCEINPSTIPGLKPGICSGLILSGAFYPVLKAGVWRRRSIKKDFGLRSILQDNHGRVSHFTHNSSSNFSFLKECNNLFRSSLLNGENKSKTLKTDQSIWEINLRSPPLQRLLQHIIAEPVSNGYR
jgi:hypothetical protein